MSAPSRRGSEEPHVPFTCEYHRSHGYCTTYPCDAAERANAAVTETTPPAELPTPFEVPPSPTRIHNVNMNESSVDINNNTEDDDDQCHLWRLPYEVREKIYVLVLCPGQKLHLCHLPIFRLKSDGVEKKNLLAIAATCKQAEQEANPVVSLSLGSPKWHLH